MEDRTKKDVWHHERATNSKVLHQAVPQAVPAPLPQGVLPPPPELDPFPASGACNGLYTKLAPAGQPTPAVGCPDGTWTPDAPGGAACAAVRASCTGASSLFQVLSKYLAVNTYCCRCAAVAPRAPSAACPPGWRPGGECAALPNWCTSPDARLFNEYFSPAHCCVCSSPGGPGVPALPGAPTIADIQVVAQGDGHWLRVTINTAGGTGEVPAGLGCPSLPECRTALSKHAPLKRICMLMCTPPQQAQSHTRCSVVGQGKPSRSTPLIQHCWAGPARWGSAARHCALEALDQACLPPAPTMRPLPPA